MGVFDRIRGWLGGSSVEASSSASPISDFWYTSPGFRENSEESEAGTSMSSDYALRVAAVYACVRVIAESLAQLPVYVLRRTSPETTERLWDHPLMPLLTRRPNPWQTSYEWFETMVGVAAMRGNAYSLRLGQGATPDALIPLNPDRMKVGQISRDEASAFRLSYEYTWADGEQVKYTQDEILHLRGLSTDGVLGLSPLALARGAVSMAKNAEAIGVQQFSRRPMMAGILQHPKTISEEAGKRMSASFRKAYSGREGWHGVAVLEEGVTWQAVGMSNSDAEFLATRQFQVTDIARWFRVPPHMIADLSKATFSNIEQQSIEFVQYTLTPWISRFESMLERTLLTRDEEHIRIEPDGLLRGTTDARFKAYGQAIKDGWMTRNEVREREDLNPLEGLDEPLQPLNMATVDDEQPAAQPQVEDTEVPDDG